MSSRALRRLVCGLFLLGAGFAFQRQFRVYQSMEPYDSVPIPHDALEKSEWVFGRLMYPQHPQAHFARFARRSGGSVDWREGGTSWAQDYPRADRHFAQALRRLTPVHPRSADQPVNLDDGAGGRGDGVGKLIRKVCEGRECHTAIVSGRRGPHIT